MTGQYWFNEDNDDGQPRCVLCGTPYDLAYCGTCDEYFCSVDVNDWPARAMAAAAKAKKHIMEKFV